MTLPQDIAEMIRYNDWWKLSWREKMDLVNCAITDIFMDERTLYNKYARSRIAQLNKLRLELIGNNWVKPKYDD